MTQIRSDRALWEDVLLNDTNDPLSLSLERGKMKILITYKGGEGSGNFGHEGRPGQVGGSAPDGSAASDHADTSTSKKPRSFGRAYRRELEKDPIAAWALKNPGKTIAITLGAALGGSVVATGATLAALKFGGHMSLDDQLKKAENDSAFKVAFLDAMGDTPAVAFDLKDRKQFDALRVGLRASDYQAFDAGQIDAAIQSASDLQDAHKGVTLALSGDRGSGIQGLATVVRRDTTSGSSSIIYAHEASQKALTNLVDFAASLKTDFVTLMLDPHQSVHAALWLKKAGFTEDAQAPGYWTRMSKIPHLRRE
jgi:hypothetical protein